MKKTHFSSLQDSSQIILILNFRKIFYLRIQNPLSWKALLPIGWRTGYVDFSGGFLNAACCMRHQEGGEENIPNKKNILESALNSHIPALLFESFFINVQPNFVVPYKVYSIRN
jgi:hypothetical protein